MTKSATPAKRGRGRPRIEGQGVYVRITDAERARHLRAARLAEQTLSGRLRTLLTLGERAEKERVFVEGR